MGNFDEEIYANQVKSYKNYLVSFLKRNSLQDGIELFETLENQQLGKSKRSIRVLSLYDIYKSNKMPFSEDSNLDLTVIKEESELKYKYFQEMEDKYDPKFFRNITPEQVEQITIEKFKSYRDQGKLIQELGGILIADELPPVVKANMYGNKLLMMWPWIRKEAQERNPDYEGVKPRKVRLVEGQV
jgi:hypothetical protein